MTIDTQPEAAAPPVVSTAYLRRHAFRIHAPGPRIEARIGRLILEHEAQHHKPAMPPRENQGRARLDRSEMQRKIALLMEHGWKSRAIARELGLTRGAVEHQMTYIRRGGA